jgi:hypothetical protein
MSVMIDARGRALRPFPWDNALHGGITMKHGAKGSHRLQRGRALMTGALVSVLVAPCAASADTRRDSEASRPSTSTPPTQPAKPKARGRAPIIRLVNTSVSGHLPPELVRRIVRQNYGQFRLCYERGLDRNPALAGQVKTLFVIDLEGDVSKASNDGSDLADADVVQCIVSSFKRMNFPRSPEPVTVHYTIALQPN